MEKQLKESISWDINLFIKEKTKYQMMDERISLVMFYLSNKFVLDNITLRQEIGKIIKENKLMKKVSIADLIYQYDESVSSLYHENQQIFNKAMSDKRKRFLSNFKV